MRVAVPLEKIRKLYDSLRLLLEIHPSGGKYWRFKYGFGGGEKAAGAGGPPDGNVRDGRKLRDEARKSASHSARNRSCTRRRCVSCWIATELCRSGWARAV
ncbi:Arm DNA-binding domain-containing protein [Caballeronia sp. LP003]|uniref:Arm DNA-binding domain-containing protein n=1 Tax=Caballeronia sp. LP003 TaxID=3038551 RepID=UPI0038572054